VENNQPADHRLGPRAGMPRRPLSPSRLAILEQLRDQPEPLTQAALVRITGLHPNTVREHLEGLLRVGFVRRFAAPPQGRGRPAWLYETTPEGDNQGQGGTPGEYAGLAAALAGTLAATSADPRADAVRAGEAWGRELVRNRGASDEAGSPEDARDRVVSMLDDLGFAPQRDDDPAEVNLTHCPLLAAAHRHPDVVCGVHLGIVRGALLEYGAPPDGAQLEAFARPGACRLVVPPLSPTGPPLPAEDRS
jgi:predicted ArsR family transcriptional regulator